MIANSPKAREVCDSFPLGRLAARVYPHASVGRLYVLADWMSAYFILNDVLDDTVEAPMTDSGSPGSAVPRPHAPSPKHP